MYCFPNIDELKSLIGQNLIQIGCTANQIVFYFDKDRITCEKGFKLTNKNGIDIDVGIPLNALELLGIIESKVEAIVENGNKNLIITFDNGEIISLFDDDYYESYQMNISQKEFVV